MLLCLCICIQQCTYVEYMRRALALMRRDAPPAASRHTRARHTEKRRRRRSAGAFSFQSELGIAGNNTTINHEPHRSTQRVVSSHFHGHPRVSRARSPAYVPARVYIALFAYRGYFLVHTEQSRGLLARFLFAGKAFAAAARFSYVHLFVVIGIAFSVCAVFASVKWNFRIDLAQKHFS